MTMNTSTINSLDTNDADKEKEKNVRSSSRKGGVDIASWEEAKRRQLPSSLPVVPPSS